MGKGYVVNVNDFDIQLFGSEEDPSGENVAPQNEETPPIAKIKVGESAYTPEELQGFIKDSQNNTEWKKANTVAAQKIAEERKTLEAELQKMEAWRPFISKYEEDEVLQQEINSLLDGNNQDKGEDASQLDTYKRELADIKKELAIEKAIRLSRQQSEDNQLIEMDKRQVEDRIKTNGDMFSYAEVEKFATENTIPLMSVAYDILRGSDANIAHHAAKARAAALAEYEKKSPPRIAPNGGQGGIVGQETPFVSFRDAAAKAAIKYPNVWRD